MRDKLLVTGMLDELGFDFIEGGYPLSNPKDFEYFQRVREMPLRHAQVVAFGMTRRKGVSAAKTRGCGPWWIRKRRWSRSSGKRGTCMCSRCCGSTRRRTSR